MNQPQNKNQGPSDGAFAIGALALVGVAVWSQKQYQIKLWFYDNMMSFVLLGLMFIVGLSLYVRHKIRKKNKRYFERKENLSAMRPTHRPNDYYKRKDFK